jgi:anaerobic selenocysteine-containing dehydrogenase/ferredoxin-NADP reductase
MPPADYENADTILLWGHNPANTWLAQANAVAQGRSKGANMVVVDPRPTMLARQADVWLPVRPGTDAALALGLIKLVIDQELFDDQFVRAWTNAPLLVRSDTGLFLRERSIWREAEHDRYVVWDERSGTLVPYEPDMATPVEQARSWKLRGDLTISLDGTGEEVTCAPAFEFLVRGIAPYDLAQVQEITGVEPDAMKAAVQLLRGGRRLAYHAWTGIGQHTNATQTERAVATLYALTGSFDRIGGNRVRRGPFFRPVNGLGCLSPAQKAKALGIDKRPIGPPATGWVTARDTYRAILEGKPYKVRAMMAFGTNLPVSQGDSTLAEEALAALEFHVHCDLFETPAAKYADLFLPVNSPWEHEGIRFGFEINDDAASHVQFRQRMVPPRGESRSDNEIVFDLACRLGMADGFFDGSVEAGWNHMLEPIGLTVEDLRKTPSGAKCAIDAREQKYALAHHDRPEIIRGFDTQTRRVEIYSELLHRHGQPGIATYLPPNEHVRQAKDQSGAQFPLILSSAKNGYYCHSQHRSLASLRKRAPDPIAEISPALAAEHGIFEGDWIRISTRVGNARFVAKITPQLADDLVVAEFGWWQACPELDRGPIPITGDEGSNFNSLISADACDPVSGSVAHRSFRCNIALDPLTERRQRRWSGYRQFRVTDLRHKAHGVLGVHFEPIDGGELPDFRPGQHIEIQAPIGSELVSRTYSLTGPACMANRKSYSIAVRHQKGVSADNIPFEGRMSSHIHRDLRVGDLIEAKAPSGRFVVPRVSPQPLILLAGGIGITPFINLLESLPNDDPLEIWLYYANQNSRTHAFRERIREHCARLPNLTVVNHYVRPVATDRLGVDYQSQERITANIVSDDLIARRARVYMCGPLPMMDSFEQGLVARGVPKFDIFREIFRSPTGLLPDDGRTFKVTFASSRKEPAVWSAADGPLLSFGESLGVALPSGCRVGQCESCEVRVVSGKVAHLHGTEPDDPLACLTCQAIPIEDVVLDA